MKSSTATLVDGTLAGHLWEAANILRGPVDAADFKTTIFPLLFFKRLSDVYDEECAIALAESAGDMAFAQFPENHRFQIPADCHWQGVRARSSNIGHALQQAMRGIEQANPDTLHGTFGTIVISGSLVCMSRSSPVRIPVPVRCHGQIVSSERSASCAALL